MSITRTSSSFREKEILEVLFRNGWGYMRSLIIGSKTEEPEIPPPAVLKNILTELGPVFVKFGQLLSTRPDLLPPDYIVALSELQAKVPAVEASIIEEFIRQRLPVSPDAAFSQINYQAIAAGSIGQIHRATLKDGREVAVKVQRPGIDKLIERDTLLLKRIANLGANTSYGERYDIVGLAEEFSRALQSELNFTTEGRYTEQLRTNLAKSSWFDAKALVVPEIFWELSNEKILVMEWLNGKPILKARLEGKNYKGDIEAEKQAITTLLFRAFFQQFFLDGFFHADPHPGNIFYLDDTRVALLDCGMVGNLDPRTRNALTEMILAMVSSDAQRCTQLALQIAEPTGVVNLARVELEARRMLQRYSGQSLGNLNAAEVVNELLEVVSRNNFRWPGNIGLFAKSLANLEGAARQFNPALNIEEEIRPLMTDIFQRQLLGENPLQTVLRTGLELRNLSLESPRQLGFVLNRLSTETLKLQLSIPDLNLISQSIDAAANRRTLSTVISGLIVGAAIISTAQQTPQLKLINEIFFVMASLMGIWLVISLIRSSKSK